MRVRQERLLVRLDSLRRELDSRGPGSPDRERVADEMNRTVLALQRLLDASAHSGVIAAQLAAEAVEAAQGDAVRAQITILQGFRTRGYLGVTFDGPNRDVIRSGERLIRFYQYPRIALVEPSSPAERAGILQGDTLLALNGTDIRENEVSLTKLLIPESKIVMRVRREGNSKDLRVIVGEAPEYYVERGGPPTPRPGSEPDGPRRVRVPGVPQQGETPVPRMPAVWVFNNGIAGAHVLTITEGLGKVLRVKEGVLVTEVMPGTPAHEAGLRDGDIVTQADGRSVATIRALQRVVAEGNASEGVRLLVVREGKQRDILLRWQ